MTYGITPQEIHPTFVTAFNRQDLDALMALYAPDAVMARPDGSLATGLDAIREELSGILGTNRQITFRTRYVVEAGDLALLSCAWRLTTGDETMSAVTAEVARRQPDGGWLYVVDHPFASLEPDETAATGPLLPSS